MDDDDVKFMEHIAIASDLTLEEFCAVAQRTLGLPDFKFDGENETEWGISVKDSIEYNISRPYEPETLRSWDSTVPHGCNFGLILIFPKSAAETAETSHPIVRQVCETLANVLGTPLHHHRAWLGPGINLARKGVFVPKQE